MGLRFKRRSTESAEARQSRRAKRALHDDYVAQLLDDEAQRADLDNAGLRFAAQGRSMNMIFGLFGQGSRRRHGPTLRDQGYDGD